MSKISSINITKALERCNNNWLENVKYLEEERLKIYGVTALIYIAFTTSKSLHIVSRKIIIK